MKNFHLLELAEIDADIKAGCADIIPENGTGTIDYLVRLQMLRQLNRIVGLLEKQYDGLNDGGSRKGESPKGDCKCEPIETGG